MKTQIEKLTEATKSLIYEQLRQLESILKDSESYLQDYPEHHMAQFYTIKIEVLEVQIEFLKSKLFS